MTKYSDCKNEWFEMWYNDKKGMLSIMYSNMASDLKCGYDPMGKSIVNQQSAIDEYRMNLNATLNRFLEMDEKQVDKWCYYDMLKRGVIE